VVGSTDPGVAPDIDSDKQRYSESYDLLDAVERQLANVPFLSGKRSGFLCFLGHIVVAESTNQVHTRGHQLDGLVGELEFVDVAQGVVPFCKVVKIYSVV
jgi:hypothetical protein